MKAAKLINWIFFDVGGVLLNDDKYEEERIKLILEIVSEYTTNISSKDILKVRPKASAMFGGLTTNIIKLLLPNKIQQESAIEKAKIIIKQSDYSGHSFIRPEAKSVVEILSKKYSLGLLANQPVVTKEKLEKSGILQHFKFQGVSEDFYLKKPDPEFFKAIFKATGADPEKSAIIDDNIERGLVSAKKLGMTTVWFKLETRDISNDIDFVTTSLSELLEIFYI